jgi:hypothetical protein
VDGVSGAGKSSLWRSETTWRRPESVKRLLRFRGKDVDGDDRKKWGYLCNQWMDSDNWWLNVKPLISSIRI